MACARNALAKGRAAAKEWAAAAMHQGAKLAHRWTARIGAKLQLAEEVIGGTSHSFTPLDMMASRFNAWEAKWQNTHETTQDAVTAIQEVRICAMASPQLPMITWPAFYKKPYLELEDKMSVDLLNECERKVAWPLQAFITLHLEPHEEAFCSRVVLREGGFCGTMP